MTKFAVSDLKGKRFGRLVIQERTGKDKSGRNWFWKGICDCGGEIITMASNLRQNRTRSCGCLQKESWATSSITHGHTRGSKPSPEYVAWQGMRARCGNPKDDKYEYYGGRGILVCDRWLHSFENFLADMGLRPSATHSLDRENVNGYYEPTNCRWATKQEQMINRRVHCARCGEEIFCPSCSENK